MILGSNRWRLRNWRLRTKLLVLLLVPLLLAVVLGAFRVGSAASDAGSLRTLADQVGVSQQTSAAIHELQRERNLAAGYVAAGRDGDRTALDAQIVLVDERLAQLAGVPDESLGQAASAYDAAQARIGGLAALRDVIVNTSYTADATIIAYSSVIQSLATLERTLLTGADGALQGRATELLTVTDAKEQVERQHASLLAAILGGSASSEQQATIRSAGAQFDASIADFENAADPTTIQLYSDTVAGAQVDNRERLEQAALVAISTGAPLLIAAQEWDGAATTTTDLIRQVEIGLLDQLRDGSTALSNDARADAIRDAIIVTVLVLAALALLTVVSQSLLRPLRVLRTTAFDVADRRLPQAIERMKAADGQIPELAVEPVGVYTREEVGQVARAFDAVHGEAIRLAAEQALLRNNVNDIFVNLSRRSQGLVERQLRLIDELENSEQDPEQLGNLFQLDHLATRMRRNSENLLVLAGAELRQRTGRPVAALDVLRAAVSEVEEYRRVVVKRPPTVAVAGHVVNDLVHLVAELLDNATSFSPPDTKVVLSSDMLDDGGLSIAITDSGVGINAPDLQDINHRLAEPPVVDVAVSRRMGLFVVGRLAQRHDVVVRLRPHGTGQGLLALVTVPAMHLTVDPAVRAGGDRQADSDWAGPDIDVPLQVAVVDAPGDSDVFSPSDFAAFDEGADRVAEQPPVQQEWDSLFGASENAPRRERIEYGSPFPDQPTTRQNYQSQFDQPVPGPPPLSDPPSVPPPYDDVVGSDDLVARDEGPFSEPQATQHWDIRDLEPDHRGVDDDDDVPVITEDVWTGDHAAADHVESPPVDVRRDDRGYDDPARDGDHRDDDHRDEVSHEVVPSGLPRRGDRPTGTQLDSFAGVGYREPREDRPVESPSQDNGYVAAGPVTPPPVVEPRPEPARSSATDRQVQSMAEHRDDDGPIFEEMVSAWFRERHSGSSWRSTTQPAPTRFAEPTITTDTTVAAATDAPPPSDVRDSVPAADPVVSEATWSPDETSTPPAGVPLAEFESSTATPDLPVEPEFRSLDEAPYVPEPVATNGNGNGNGTWSAEPDHTALDPVPDVLPTADAGRRADVGAVVSQQDQDIAAQHVAAQDVTASDDVAPARRVREPVDDLPDEEWGTAADAGWEAAEAVRSPSNSGFTAAGLPKRRPKAHLVPGAAGANILAPASGSRSPTRSADTVRGRLSSYQRGLREGRDAREDGARERRDDWSSEEERG